MNELSIVTGQAPAPLVRYAAEQLQYYVQRLFGMRAAICAADDDAQAKIILDATAAQAQAPDDDQEFLLRRLDREGRPVLAAIGGSPVATMWAVYDLVERWGVRYLLRGDVFPPSTGPFHLPDLDVIRQPNLRFRGVRLINLFSMGLESWGAADINRYVDQLAKLKFNAIYHQLWCWQPFIHYECRGMAKTTGRHWFGCRYAIDDQTIGRHHFGGLSEFVPPDFANCHTYQDRVCAAQRMLHSTFDHAKRRGFHTQICTSLTDFTPEFSEVLGGGPQQVRGWGQFVPGGRAGADDPGFQDLCATALRTYIDTYPEVDRYTISMPEDQPEEMPFEPAWNHLDKKYGFSKVRSLEQVLQQANTRTDYPGGSKRIVRKLKGNIVLLDLFDRLLTETKILANCSKPQAEVRFSHLSEELCEVYNLMQPGAVIHYGLDYTSSRVAKRPEAFERIRQSGVNPILIMTTQDDNVGVVPQLTTLSNHTLLEHMRRYDWQGFQLRYWMICDMEPTVAHLAAGSWDETVTRSATYNDHIRHLCGEPAEEELTLCFQILDEVTVELGDHGLGVGFPVPAMAIRHWNAGGSLDETFVKDREQWRAALGHARRARILATRGHDYLDYLIGRIEFGISYIDTIELAKTAGESNRTGDRDAALRYLEQAVNRARQTVAIHARICLGPTDLGTLAQLNEDLYRKLDRLLTTEREGRGK